MNYFLYAIWGTKDFSRRGFDKPLLIYDFDSGFVESLLGKVMGPLSSLYQMRGRAQ